jgi:PKD repeat protein
MPRFFYLPLFALSLTSCILPLNAQNGCPGCAINLPPLPADTIYLSDAPDGEAGAYYSGDISFRMPKSTTPVNAMDPSTPAGLAISKINIITAVNLPPGLTWEASQTEFKPDNETDGCVKFCGVPLQPGLYNVEVFVTAEVLLISQSTSFSFPMYIAPSSSNTVGFSMQNSAGCGEVTVDFENNIPSNANPGYSYKWDFGNGVTSTLENPEEITYDQPGAYEVKYEATIDTFGYMLTSVQVVKVGCSDLSVPPIFNGAPDLYVKIKDPSGTFVFISGVVDNSPVPFVFNVNLPLTTSGNYELEVRDDDTFGSESCGYINFNKFTNGDTLTAGQLRVIVNIIHPVFTISSVDTVFVYAVPEAPKLIPDQDVTLCKGEELELTTDYSSNIQWFNDTLTLFGKTAPVLAVNSAGSYWVEYTSPDGCKAQSEKLKVHIVPLPSPPAFHNEQNLLVLNDTSLLPADYSLQWFQDDIIIPGATGLTYCVTTPGVSLFTLEVTDNATGCTNKFSLGVIHNANFNCLVPTKDVSLLKQSLHISPNPATDKVRVSFETTGTYYFNLVLLDATGRVVLKNENLVAPSGLFIRELDMAHLPAGMYFLQIITSDVMVGGKIIKNNL